MIKQTSQVFFAMMCMSALTGCLSETSNYMTTIEKTPVDTVMICHGYSCTHKTKLNLLLGDQERFSAIMSAGVLSPQAEREAISQAIRYYESRSTQTIGVKDKALSTLHESGKKGQMDCIDESTNSRSIMLYLQKRGLLKHHRVLRNVRRGLFLDARYPHSTAVIQEINSGKKWAVDSWYEEAGGPADIVPLKKWLGRGVLGQR